MTVKSEHRRINLNIEEVDRLQNRMFNIMLMRVIL